MLKKIVIIIVFLSVFVAKAQNNEAGEPHYNKDMIIGSFSSSIVFLIHTQLDMLINNSDNLIDKKKYYLSQLNITSIINTNFRNSLDDFMIKGNPSKSDNKLLVKLVRFSQLYTNQINAIKDFIENQDEDRMRYSIELHSQMKENINDLFNTNRDEE